MVKISIILPVYNVESYLSRCLDSLINQTIRDIEIICVNDASLDNSIMILNEYKQKDSRIKVIDCKKNGGAAIARQKGLDVATGEYIGFVDPDDYVDLDFFEKLYSLAVSDKADIAKGNVITIELDGTEVVQKLELNNMISKDKFKFFGQNLWDAIYSAKMIKEHQIHFEIDTFCFGLQAAFWANKIAVRNDAFYRYVRRENSVDSKCFTVEKWKRWGIRGAKFYLSVLNKNDYLPEVYARILCDFVFPIYFYGYNRLSKEDRRENISYLAYELLELGKNLKNRHALSNAFGVYSDAILNSDMRKLIKLIKIENIKCKYIRAFLFKLAK